VNVCIHQPQYLPWLPYFLKIQKSDLFIILDSVDFQKNGLQNRNQIKANQGAHWLTVPVRQQLGQKILDVRIDNGTVWRRKHWQAIQNNYGKTPEFRHYKSDLESIYMREWAGICDLNIEMISMIMRWMKIETPILRSSQMTATGVASDLVLNLCLEVGATHYLSGSGGESYLKPESFKNANVEIVYQKMVLPKAYPQHFTNAGFVNNLSVIDILFNCGENWSNYLPIESAK
jgi:hypothetical protein